MVDAGLGSLCGWRRGVARSDLHQQRAQRVSWDVLVQRRELQHDAPVLSGGMGKQANRSMEDTELVSKAFRIPPISLHSLTCYFNHRHS